MKILDLEQGSEEWLHFREGKIGGSDAREYAKPRYIPKDELVAFAKSKGYEFNKALTIDNIRGMMTQDELNELDATVRLNDSIYKLIASRIAKPINPNDYEMGNMPKQMARGHALEPEAREAISKALGKKVLPGRVWQSSVSESLFCSVDGEIVTRKSRDDIEVEIIEEAVEIKCLESWKIVKAFYENAYPVEYHQQAIQPFVINEKLEKLHFCLYSDVFASAPQMELQIFTIHRKDIESEIESALHIELSVVDIVNEEVSKLMF